MRLERNPNSPQWTSEPVYQVARKISHTISLPLGLILIGDGLRRRSRVELIIGAGLVTKEAVRFLKKRIREYK